MEFDQYQGKKVVVVYVPQGKTEAEELEGTAQVANSKGVLIKPKGKTTLELIEPSQIEDIRFVVEKPKALARKVLKLVEFGQARNHLLERHGYTLAQVNDMDEQQAFDAHNAIDHEATDLGHTHGDKAEAPAAAAVAEAESA